ncbi:peptidylprolyl isomerase [Burkholderiaceae bacterium FT117]|uniref:peptidylprolyl isomerase n=1 Tax=Zeimonas sediminis TaxID=2944268 RepID=UPI002342FB0A|nr:peptidylprolyl isomerase [Zeimonas sediminis]MCM5570295.1 peptidylprolyl isomerase [Zeimonas sediminis]
MKHRLSLPGALRPVIAALAFAMLASAASAQLRAPTEGGSGLRLPGAASQSPAAPSPAATSSPGAAGQASPAPGNGGAGGIRELDRVVAVVNDDVITLRELERRAELVSAQLRRQGTELPPRDVLLRQLLERMIVDRAQLQLARDYGIRVDEQQLDRAIAGIAQENKLSVAQLRERVEREGQSFARFREDIRGEILRARLREREVDSKVQVSEADIDAYLASQESQPGSAEYRVAQILLRVPEGASPEQIERQRLRGEEIRKQLEGGESFARLAAAFSDAPDALSGGMLGWRKPERLPELFAQALAPMKEGEISGLLRSPAGFHLLQLVERRDSGGSSLQSEPVTQTRARHILIRPNEVISEDEAFRRLREIRERVQAGTADFAEMARQYSADGSAGRGGDLGWIYPGDTVPEFERAMNALAPGQVGEPVRTPFGVHLIQVLERRSDEASPERLRQRVREILRARRIEERYQDWLRQLRDSTYVEYKLDGN